MSKIIKMTPEIIERCKEEFEEFLSNSKISGGTINFRKTLDSVDKKATLTFTENAWWKMQLLIDKFSDEVAWHGIAARDGDENDDKYVIYDIVVYPQEVGAATVDTDQTKYQDWLYGLDDYQFNNLRMQGHSHVNMGVTPSPVDEAHQDAILSQLSDDMFYIFLIWNKKNDRNIRIYDLKKNTLFETKDVEVVVEGDNLTDFLADAGSKVTKKTYGFNYYKPKQETTKSNDNKKDKQPNSRVPSKYFPKNMSEYDDDDDWEDPYGPFGYSERGYYGY